MTGFASKFSSVDTVARIAILEYVERAFDPSYFGGACHPTYRLARIYLALHTAAGPSGALGGAAGTRGPITGESAGGMSKSYAAIGSTFSADGIAAQLLARTVWGGYLLELIEASAARGPMVI